MFRSARERVVQSLVYEVTGLLLAAPLYTALFGQSSQQSVVLVVTMSVAVLAWSPLHNAIFDLVEFRLTTRPASDRPALLRLFHAISLEGSDIVVTLPLIMLIGGHGFAEGIMVDVGFTLFYAAYAYVFFWAYDWLRPITAERAMKVGCAAA